MITLLKETSHFNNREGGTFVTVITYELAKGNESPTHFWIPDGSNTIEPIGMLQEYVDYNTTVRRGHLLMPCDLYEEETVSGIIIDKAAMVALITQTWEYIYK